jgi:hypothetical protein
MLVQDDDGISPEAASKSELTYDDWAELLAEFFFDEAHNGGEVLFAVDEVSLAEIADRSENVACSSLARAVLLVIGPQWDVGAVRLLTVRWREHGLQGPHPALPFLALTVLAASRMGSYDGFAANKFYVPLRRSLQPDDHEINAPGTYLDLITYLWNDLAWWANKDLEGLRGRLTIRDPGYQYGRGLAVQHALVKSSDLHHLDAFFRRIGLRPGEDVVPVELRRALQVWSAGRPQSWAKRMHRISTEDDLAQYAEALLEREARRWDGRPRDPRTGRPVGHIRIGLSALRQPRLTLYAQWDERLPDTVDVSSMHGAALLLTRRHGWYEPSLTEVFDPPTALAGGLTLRGDGIRFGLRSDDVHALSYDDDLGAWVSVDSMSYGDRYHLIVSDDVAEEVLHFVNAESTTDPSISRRATSALPTGWKLITDVRIDGRPLGAPPGALASLVPAGSGPRLRMFGGLPLPIGHGVYLHGGEPALGLSTVSEDDVVSICRTSTGDVERFRVGARGDREFQLWHLRLDPGSYEIQNGQSRVSLRIVDGITEAAGSGAGTIAHRGRTGADVVGTSVAEAVPHRRPLTVSAPPSGERSVLLGARPDEHYVIALPSWLADRAGELSWRTIDAWPSFDPTWHLMRGKSGRYEATLIASAEPVASDGASGSQWGRLISVATLRPGESDEAAALWERYRQAAMTVVE